jgi:hypothetical protein
MSGRLSFEPEFPFVGGIEDREDKRETYPERRQDAEERRAHDK